MMNNALRLVAYLCLLAGSQAQINSQCNVDLNCWQMAPGCTLADGFPFERRTPVNCSDCVALCQSKQQGQYPYICKSVVWDCRFKTCDLFAVQASNPQRLTKYKDRTYFQSVPGGQCAVATTTATSAIQDCPAGQKSILSIFQNSTVANLAGGQPVSADTSEKCGVLCVQNQDDKGQPFPCKAASFSQGKCTLSQQAPSGDTTKNIQAVPGDDKALYLEKKCYPSDQAGPCSSIVLDPHHVLVGQNRKTSDAKSYDDCLAQCIKTTEFKCKSGQYYADVQTENCVLNEETRTTKPDLYLATDDNNIYFEPRCQPGRKIVFAAKKVKAKLSLRDVPFTTGEWTLWTDCKPGQATRHRYRNCKATRIQQCDKQFSKCPNSDLDEKSGIIGKILNGSEESCVPVQVEVKGQRKPRCDLGYIYHKNGTRTYCVPKRKDADCVDLGVVVKA